MSGPHYDLSGLHSGDEHKPAFGREASPPDEFAPRPVLFLGGPLHGSWRIIPHDKHELTDRKNGASYHKVTEQRGRELVEFMLLDGMPWQEQRRLIDRAFTHAS